MTPLMKESAINLRNAYGEFIAADDLSSIRIGFEQFWKKYAIECKTKLKTKTRSTK